MHTTPLRGELRRKYRDRKFLQMTEQAREALWGLVVFAVGISFFAYMAVHFMLWITGYYTDPIGLIVTHY